jgi:RNA polymerase sigma-70 factor (ECF subfamily)
MEEPPVDEDLHCMERLRDGDDLALNDLMRRWKEPLVTFSLRYTGNVTDAREIAQETFVKVYAARKRYRPSAFFSSWLFTIAANLCRMRSRWRSRHPEILEADRDEACDAPADNDTQSDDPSVEADRNSLASDLDRAIQSLPHDLRVTFVLYEIQGYLYREVSDVLGCSEKAVERRLTRARERLRSLLKPKWEN